MRSYRAVIEEGHIKLFLSDQVVLSLFAGKATTTYLTQTLANQAFDLWPFHIFVKVSGALQGAPPDKSTKNSSVFGREV